MHEHLDDASSFRALGFCVNVDHARYMARFFSEHGIESRAVWGESTAQAREDALEALREGSVRVVFSVDLFNEGVDLPDVDTLLLLRPTESATLFLQQLGRGLRRSRNKSVCTVLDFVGIAAEFAIISSCARCSVVRARGFETPGHGGLSACLQAATYSSTECHATLFLEPYVARSRQVDRQGRELRPRTTDAACTGGPPARDRSRARRRLLGCQDVGHLCADAGLAVLPSGPHEVPLRRAVGRLLHVDDTARIEAYTRLLTAKRCPAWTKLNGRDRRYARMLAAQLGDQVFQKDRPSSEAWPTLFEHPQVLTETTG
ncbi:MAG: hypothetical protein IPG17_14620 [Sandaracinaceae bacterium]|nr:hypothetical protein [Sandaracinaceae bacterium]